MNFWEKNKVFITGLLGAIVLGLQPFLTQTQLDWKVLGFAVLMAVLSFIANTWRGQGITIIGIIGSLAFAFTTLQNTGTFSWQQFMLAAVVAILSAVAPPAKNLSYEHSPTIVDAKEEGKKIEEGKLTNAETGKKEKQ